MAKISFFVISTYGLRPSPGFVKSDCFGENRLPSLPQKLLRQPRHLLPPVPDLPAPAPIQNLLKRGQSLPSRGATGKEPQGSPPA